MIIGNCIKLSGFKCVITINNVANATVTATGSTSGAVYTAVADSSGVATITVKKKDTYSITSTGTTRVGHATVSDKNPVTAVYNWTKWNSVAYYAQSVQNSWSTTDTLVLISTDYRGWTTYQRANGYSFNTGDGRYYLTGGSLSTISSSSDMCYADTSPYCAYPGQGSTASQMFVVTKSGSSTCYITGYLGDIRLVRGGSKGTTAYAYLYGSAVGGYNKGSTSYGTVTSTALSAYPDNGRYATDGYWYVAT